MNVFAPKPSNTSVCRFKPERREPVLEFAGGIVRAAIGSLIGCLLALFIYEKITELRIQAAAKEAGREIRKALKAMPH